MCRIGKILFFCVIVIMIVSVGVLAQQTQRPIRLGFDIDYPPFSFVDKAAPVGFDVDVVRELNQYSQQKIEIVLDTWSTVQADLNTGKIDAVGGILYTEERAKIYDFTIPYNYEPAVVFISKKTMANSIQDLQNKKLADIKGDPLAENILRNNGISAVVDSYPTYTEVFFSLEKGKNDFTIVPYSLGMEIIKKNAYNNVISMGPNVATCQYRMAVKKGNTEVVSVLNMAIERMRETDFLNKNQSKWIKYKNDGVSWLDFVGFALYILVPVIILILIIAVYVLKREIARKTMLLQERNAELTKLAMLDPWTELYNRRRFYELAGIEFALAQKSGITFGLLMIDIDWFKNFNDKFGHDIGDQIILHLAQTFKTYFRVDDVICRFGGEEFIVLLPKTTEEMAKNIAERIRQLISEDEFNISDGRIVKYTLSIGVATFRMSDDDLDQIIKRADTALYEAKHEGRNRIVICPSVN